MNSIHYELSADDIVRVLRRYDPTFNKTDIVEYPDLINYNLNLLLPRENDYKVILFITNKHGLTTEGHWCVLCRKNGKVMWFDPYSLQADAERNWITPQKQRLYGENKPILHELVPKNQLVSNPYHFQSKRAGTNTCGRWCCEFIIHCCIKNHSIEQFHDYIENLKKHSGLSNDQIICKLVRV